MQLTNLNTKRVDTTSDLPVTITDRHKYSSEIFIIQLQLLCSSKLSS